MEKLHQYGVSGIPPKLMKSYLTSRTQKFKVTCIANNQLKEYLSSGLPIRYGIHESSVLDPLLFILYVIMYYI
jgi:hypothetical protein